MSIGPEICWNWVQGEEDDNKGAKIDFIRNGDACEMEFKQQRKKKEKIA